jgi:meso-butanediol dehydrogenase / (S,S)-butanediol dehydrogenase / diacetyl reductase
VDSTLRDRAADPWQMCDNSEARVRRFCDRVVVVTGAGSGIGDQIATDFADQGAVVVVADLDPGRARDTSGRIQRNGGRAEPAVVDVTDADMVRALADHLNQAHGRLDILVNNAAVSTELPLQRLTEQQWDRDVAVSLKGTFLVTRALLPLLLKHRSGVIVNIGSVNGTQAVGSDAYSAAKAGLVALTRNIAFRLGPSGVRCNIVVPGTVNTSAWSGRLRDHPDVLDRLSRHYPLRRIGTPADVAAAVLFLASDEASWITGAALAVDGGLSCGNVALNADLFGPDDLFSYAQPGGSAQ